MIKSTNIESFNSMSAEGLLVERIKVLYEQVASVLIGNVFVASLLVSFLYFYTNNVVSLYWLSLVLVLTVIRYFLLRQYQKIERDEKSVIRWGWVFVVTAFISGCTWGLSSILFLELDNLVVLVFLLMTLTGITVGSSASLANFAWSYYAFAIPTILPFGYVLASTGEAAFIILSLMLTVFLVLQLVVAKKNQSTLDKSIILRNENTELVQQLQIKKEKAELASSAKTRFLAAASHDLRQPLHAMSIFLDVLQERSQDSEQIEIVEKIKKSSSSLESLLESLLDISKLDAGVIAIDIKPFKIQDVFDVLKNEFKVLAEEKGLSINFSFSSLSIKSDIKIIERILRNLITNSIRYTEQGKILVGCRRKEGRIVLAVYDTGIGIDKSKSDIIFEEFQQLDNHSRDRSKGLGLGLSIVKRLTELLNVDLKLESKPGKGSAFSIECERALSNHKTRYEKSASITNAGLSDKVVFVIEDEEEIRDALSLLLSGWGCKVYKIASMVEVQKKIMLFDKPDVILADYRLAHQETGVDVIRAVQNHFQDTQIPAVIITGDTAPDRIIKIEESGFQVLNKPVGGGKLRAVINAILESD